MDHMEQYHNQKAINIIYYLEELVYLSHNLLSDLFLIHDLFINWYDILFFKVGIKNEIYIKFRKKYNVKNLYKIHNIEGYNEFWSNILTTNKHVSLRYIEKFKEEYSFLISDIKNNSIIDIGANIGDTALCFAVSGAKHVYAIEPYPYSYKIALKMIKNNNLNKNITIINAACGIHGVTTVDESYKNSGGSDLSHVKKTGLKINVYSLSDLIKKVGACRNLLLKVDCEGCEYPLILNSQIKILKKFKRIQIEYHYGYRDLVKKLRAAGFDVHFTIPRLHFNKDAKNKVTVVGYIYAKHPE